MNDQQEWAHLVEQSTSILERVRKELIEEIAESKDRSSEYISEVSAMLLDVKDALEYVRVDLWREKVSDEKQAFLSHHPLADTE